jgi:hypothetical protein
VQNVRLNRGQNKAGASCILNAKPPVDRRFGYFSS